MVCLASVWRRHQLTKDDQRRSSSVYRVSNIPLNVWDCLSLFPSSPSHPHPLIPFVVPSFIERLMARYGRCILREKGVCVWSDFDHDRTECLASFPLLVLVSMRRAFSRCDRSLKCGDTTSHWIEPLVRGQIETEERLFQRKQQRRAIS